jgi:3-mercaptopyruvate sulfurtransferase SseA
VSAPPPLAARGHIPGSRNLPFQAVLEDGDWTKFRSPEAIARSVSATASGTTDKPQTW